MNTAPDLFRREALEHHAGAMRRDGHVLRIHPKWTAGAFWSLLAGAAAAVVAVVLIPVRQYASGPAVVRAANRIVLTARVDGSIVAIDAHSGNRVEQDQVLVQLDDRHERGELDAVLREIELHTRNVLLDLENDPARRTLAALQASRMRLEADIEARRIRAPQSGVVSDIRVRAGQHLSAGDIVLSLTNTDAGFYVVGLLPGSARPQLRPGLPMRLELTGYRYSYQKLEIGSVAEEVVSPSEARRVLGPDIADAVPLSGPVVLVRARLPGSTFRADERAYSFHDGMHGVAEARVRSESIILTLAPALRSVPGLLHD